jgi:hypothetical protein
MEPEHDFDLLTSKEAAAFLGITDARVRQLCIDGLLIGAIKRGHAWFIPRASLAAFVKEPPIRRRMKKQEVEIGFARPAFT